MKARSQEKKMTKGDSVYVGFGDENLIGVRKGTLSSTVNIIRLLKRYEDYKEQRAEEARLKKELCNELNGCGELLDNFVNSIPRIKEEYEKVKEEKKAIPRALVAVQPQPLEMQFAREGQQERGQVQARTKFQPQTRTEKRKSELDTELEEIKTRLAALG
ncbi:hypothetical protein J4454_00495 [Candidatus Pacearchaeota archaeon]|nr:hypothetical protein [Candidatus Pacearchaeota archaeon]